MLVRRTLINKEKSMLYSATFTKLKTYHHDEVGFGSMIFFAASDDEARSFIGTALKIMNDSYQKINEPRTVELYRLFQVKRSANFGAKKLQIRSHESAKFVPFKRWRDYLNVYRALFPGLTKIGRKACAIGDFYEYKPTPKEKLGTFSGR